MWAHSCAAIVGIVAGAVLGATSSAAAQVNSFRPSAGVFTPVQQPRPKQPAFPQFNDQQREQMLRELQARAATARPQNVCGMTVVPAPKVDPKALKKAPADRKYTLRSVPRTTFGWPASCEAAAEAPAPDTQPTR